MQRTVYPKTDLSSSTDVFKGNIKIYLAFVSLNTAELSWCHTENNVLKNGLMISVFEYIVLCVTPGELRSI